MLTNLENSKIAIIGLGYLGLPLAQLFAIKYTVIGFDINQKRINELNLGIAISISDLADIIKNTVCFKGHLFTTHQSLMVR
ncbi:hypothetical protein [Algoriphagus persicinus]|uniref:hypothetical protein n=1 Tax=Algoriphagus persicinus TaxID=3108754 RepID=UPI002B376005|nr:hypothetical protein [Algoriphagus sp. E1-3-M2]MEB2786975.1 hypothetical protein [Algoriphagus sp. E1-3-M2]